MMKVGAFRNSKQFPELKQSMRSKLGFSKHWRIGYGIESLSLMRLNRLEPLTRIIFCWAISLQQSVIKNPLSGIAQTLAFLVFSTKQLLHWQVAIPPAETPVITMVSPLQKSYFSSKCLNNSITFLEPRKYKLLSLYGIGFYRCPTYSEPSQQITNSLVQSQKTGFFSFSGESSPQLLQFFWGLQFLVVPRLEELRWQHDQRVSLRVGAPQNPPLSKQIINLFLLTPAPWWIQNPGGEPSKQAPPRSCDRSTRSNNSDWQLLRNAQRDSKMNSFILAIIIKGIYYYIDLKLKSQQANQIFFIFIISTNNFC